MKIVHCPNCQKPIEWDASSLYRPFCSKQCCIIDLGAWADNAYNIPTPIDPSELPLVYDDEDLED